MEGLKRNSRKITNIGEASEILHWDQEVMMPEKGVEARQQQLSVLSGLEHEMIVSDELKQILHDIDPSKLEREDKSNYREIKRRHERAKKVDQELVEKISSKSSTTVDKWKKARKEEDFEIVQNELEELIELKREYANQIDPNEEPYKVLFKDYEPYIEFETMQNTMKVLKENLTSIFESIDDQDAESVPNVFEKNVSEEKQLELNNEILEDLGYDLERGRLDVSEHPFTLGNQFDARITTRFDESDLSKSIFPTIHEFGHALYQLGLPQEYYGLPIGSARDLSIHESQSRLWENHVARSKPFWTHMHSKLSCMEDFEGVKTEELWRSANRINKNNLIRVEADEISYHLHIYLRYEIERKLINGEIEVEDLPGLWNDKMEQYLGVRPETDSEGVLQDIHWYQGSIGYFTTYSLGTVIAAQIFSEAETEIEGLNEKIEVGEFEKLKEWLHDKIHSKGCLYKTEELVEQATGDKITAEYFIDYIENKYSQLYDL